MDFISAFINDAVSNGIIIKNTSDIVPTTTFRRIQAEGDKRGKKNISYWLRVDRDFAYGYIKDFKSGIERRFKSYNNDPNLSRADLTRIRALLKARQAEQDIQIAERHAKIAERAVFKWALCNRGGTTPYITRKGLSGPHSARIYGENQLFIPIYTIPKNQDPQLVSWQIIYADGAKHFPFGGQKTGCCHIIGQIDPTKPIVICEGWATGASIHEALGCGVVVAFDAGNLLPVAKNIRKKYPATAIIVAADNDAAPYYTGQKSAQKVAQSVENCKVIMCPVEGKDFNDLGPEAIKTAFGYQESGGGLPAPDSLQTPAAADWMDCILTDTRGRMLSGAMQNIVLHTIHHYDLAGLFAYDDFRQSTLVMRQPCWDDKGTGELPRPITDNDITMTCATLERFGLSPSHEKAYRAISVAAEENKFNSAQRYISSMEWDGVERLGGFLSALGCNQEAPEYLSFVFKKWMTAAVKRIMEPGCKFDHVLILESQEQGLYKSTALKELATFAGTSYHTDAFGVVDIGKDYGALKLQGVVFVELSELSGFNKKDDETIRQWITQTVDEVRLPYERSVSKFSRKFVLCATTNNYDYLKDPSGNRRYWPVTICKAMDIELIREQRQQLWAEAVALYRDGLYIGPTVDENALADKERGKRMQADAWEDIVEAAIQRLGTDEFRTLDVLAKMDLKTYEKNDRAIRRVSTVLKSLGYQNTPRWDRKNNKSVRLWSKPI